MAGLGGAIHEIHSLENLAERGTYLCRIHPLSKVLVTIWYLVLVMSFGNDDISGLMGMALYPAVLMITGDISLKAALKRMRPLLLMVCLIGAANPFLDRRACFAIGRVTVTAGMLSMVSLLLKTGFAVFASYILIAATTMEQICYALRKLHVPQVAVTVLLLIYRYLVLMLKEAERITQAYGLRSPGEKGIRKSAWGSLAGQMLLRSVDRAHMVYESMLLRGFRGEFFPGGEFVPVRQSVCYVLAWGGVLLLFRVAPVFRMVGSLLMM